MSLLEPARKLQENQQHVEGSQWELGDRLLEEIPVGNNSKNNNSQKRLKEASEFLGSHGLKYSPNTLRKYREISNLYKQPATRVAGVSYKIHSAVRDAKLLTAIVNMPLPDGQSLTEEYVRRIVVEIESSNIAAFHQKRDEDRKLAEEELEAAKQQEHEALEEIKQAKTAKDEEEAEAKKADAQKKIADAQAKLKKNKSIRPTREDKKAVPPAELFPSFGLFFELKAVALKASKLADEMKKTLDKQGEHLHEDSKIAVMDLVLQVHKDWLDIANSLRGTSKPNSKRSHLSVVDDN